MADPDNKPIEPAELDRLFGRLADYDNVFLAVSGGVDSSALMHLVAKWRATSHSKCSIRVLCVDHGLRPEATEEARSVAQQAARLDLTADILTWTGSKPKTGLQAAARAARYGLMLDYIRRVAADWGCSALVTAHHRDDLAETFLMRLARGAGVDGLSAIQPIIFRDGIAILRPFVEIAKERLRSTMETAGATWIEDPSNANQQFERAKLRSARSAAGEQLGLDDVHLALTARRMQRARTALDRMTDNWLGPHLDDALLSQCGVFAWPWRAGSVLDEVAIRALMRLLPAIGGIPGPLRLKRVERLWDDMQRSDFAGATLGNCVIATGVADTVQIYREPRRGSLPEIATDLARPLIWDNRFEITSQRPPIAGLCVRPLTRSDLDTFDYNPLARAPTCPIEALAATPVIVRDAEVLAIPALNMHWDASKAPAVSRFSCRFMVERIACAAAEQPVSSDCTTN